MRRIGGVEDRREEFVAILGLSLASIGFAAAFIAGKFALTAFTPLGVASWRFLIAAAVLAPFALRRVPSLTALSGVIAPLAYMMVAGGVAYQWMFMYALAHTSATNTALLVALNPVFTVLLAPLVGERLSAKRLAGVVIAMIGAGIVMTQGDPTMVSRIGFNRGDVVALCAAGVWSTFNLAARRVVVQIPPSFTNLVVFGFGGATLFLLGTGEAPVGQILAASPVALGGLLVMAVGSSVLSGQAFLNGVRRLGVGRAVLFIYLIPVLTAVLSVLLLDEHFRLSQAAGGALVLFGIYWGTRRSVHTA